MNFASIRIVTADMKRLVDFYERLTGLTAAWQNDDFAEFVTHRGIIALTHQRLLKPLGEAITPAQNRSVIIELLDDDVDATFKRADSHNVLQPPTTMPWGNRSLLVRDPDGNLLNFFTPVTDAAKQRAARQPA